MKDIFFKHAKKFLLLLAIIFGAFALAVLLEPLCTGMLEKLIVIGIIFIVAGIPLTIIQTVLSKEINVDLKEYAKTKSKMDMIFDAICCVAILIATILVFAIFVPTLIAVLFAAVLFFIFSKIFHNIFTIYLWAPNDKNDRDEEKSKHPK